MTRALLIDPISQTISEVSLPDGIASIKSLIGQDSIDSDEVGHQNDRLYFDESCFIRATPEAKRFKLDTLAPVAGRGVVVSSSDDGKSLQDSHLSIDDLKARVSFS
jgi:hypothetical protein